jgi:hypothetical protein
MSDVYIYACQICHARITKHCTCVKPKRRKRKKNKGGRK